MRPSEEFRKLQLPPGRYGYDDRIERWQKQASLLAEAHEGTVQHLYISCLNALSLLIERYERDKHKMNSLQRCHGTLQLWAHQYGVHDGTLEATLQRSANIRQAILELLVPLCKTLLQGEPFLAIRSYAADLNRLLEFRTTIYKSTRGSGPAPSYSSSLSAESMADQR